MNPLQPAARMGHSFGKQMGGFESRSLHCKPAVLTRRFCQPAGKQRSDRRAQPGFSLRTYMYPARRKNPARRANIHFSGRAALLSQVLKVT